MKKLFTLAMFILLSWGVSFSQCDIWNGGFEEWTDLTDTLEFELDVELQDPVLAPTDWIPLVRLLEIAFSALIEDYLGGGMVDIPLFEGLKQVAGGAAGSASAVQIAGDSLFPISDLFQLIPCNDRPGTLSGYYKYTGNSMDTLRVIAQLFDADYTNEDEAIGMALFETVAGPDDFMQFEVPFTYFTEEVPDTAIIAVLTTKDMANLSDSSFYVVDEIAFDAATPVVEDQSGQFFNLYPNPVIDGLTIEWSERMTENVEIYNAMGQLQKIHVLSSPSEIIPLSDLVPGFYTLKVQTDGQVYSRRFIKQ